MSATDKNVVWEMRSFQQQQNQEEKGDWWDEHDDFEGVLPPVPSLPKLKPSQEQYKQKQTLINQQAGIGFGILQPKKTLGEGSSPVIPDLAALEKLEVLHLSGTLNGIATRISFNMVQPSKAIIKALLKRVHDLAKLQEAPSWYSQCKDSTRNHRRFRMVEQFAPFSISFQTIAQLLTSNINNDER